ncbi:39S ribosomal protein L23, mitochondrial isoform X6 [Cricetulus griseus]|uniref:Large ribosomal subunit protein uL23m n=1 Tax=Cricetulus griseus TaxID=10029 RepID=A0A9J7JKY9_CRIGR|nr:39S ribosomal protein L23, mitochondrial isoform X6 [Cricetulus griseus]XP_027297820.1 39S ribosomal protein L23, mitochondrial isoform X6 [Cricetulus griseus]
MGGPVLSINVGLGGSHGDGIWGALHTAGERTSGIAWYPLYQLGGPQLRVFRTNFFIQLVRPGTAQPEDTVQFRIPMEMTRVDLRNYLEQIYNVPVAAVRTRVQHDDILCLTGKWFLDCKTDQRPGSQAGSAVPSQAPTGGGTTRV